MFTRFRGRGIPQQLHEVSTSTGGLGLWHRLLGVAVGFPTPHSRQQDYIQVSLFTVRTDLTTEEISGCRCCPTTSREAPKLEQKMNPGFCQGGALRSHASPRQDQSIIQEPRDQCTPPGWEETFCRSCKWPALGDLRPVSSYSAPHSAPFAPSALPLVFPTSPLLRTAVP